MRISTGMIFDAGVIAMNRQTASLLHLQEQVSSGRRILTPADDPVAAAQALEVQQSQDITSQYSTNQSNAKSALGLADAALSGVNDLLSRVRQLAVQGGNATLSIGDRQSVANELSANFDQLLGLANTSDGTGQYLFSGYQGSTKPFAGTVANGVTYAGDGGQRQLQVSASRQLGISDAGIDVFQRIANGNGFFATGYSSANTGTGVIDAGNVSDPAKWASATNSGNLQVRFWTAPAAGQVVGGVDFPAAGLSVATGTNDKFNIAVDGGAVTQVTLLPGNYTTAAALAAAVQTGIDTALGSGIATASVVTVNGKSRLAVTSNNAATNGSVSLSAVSGNTAMAALFGTPTTGTTYYDLVDMSTPTPTSLFTGSASTTGVPGNTYSHAFTADVPITFSGLAAAYNPPSNDFGVSVIITGAPASGDTFTVSKSTAQDIFTTLSNLINTLSSPQSRTPAGNAALANEIGFALTNLDQSSNNILRVRSMIGARLNEVDALDNSNSALSLQYQKTLSTLQDLDYAKALSDLTRSQTGLTAAQKSFQLISQLSLFNYLP